MMDKKGHPHPPRHVVRLELHAQQLKNVAGFRGISGALRVESFLVVLPCGCHCRRAFFHPLSLSPYSPVP
jgi:hypothetical protein